MASSDEVGHWASPRREYFGIVGIPERQNVGSETTSGPQDMAVHCLSCAHGETKYKPRKIRRLRHPRDSFLLINLVNFFVIFLIHVLLFLVCVPLLLLFPVVLLLRKLILFFVSKSFCCKSESQRQMAIEDAIWLHNTQKDSTLFSSIFLLLDSALTAEEVHKIIADKWMCYCSLNATCTFPKLLGFGVEISGGYVWKKVNDFQLENYVRHLETSSLGADDINEDRTDLIFLAPQVQHNSSLWRIAFFPKVNQFGDSGLLLQVHNSICDVFPVVRLTLESFGYKTVYLKDSCFRFKRQFVYSCAALVGPLCVLKRLLMYKDTAPLCCCRSRSLDCAGRRNERMLWSSKVDMLVVKRIKDITRTTVDVVILSCLAGALRSYMKLCGVENPCDIRACLQVDVRPLHAGLKLDNQFTPVFVKLPVGTEGAVPRLWETKRRINTFGHVLEKFVMRGFIRLCSVLFPSRIARSLVEFLVGKASCSVSYILGPTAPLYLNGKMVKLMTFWPARLSKAELSLSFLTHGKQLRFGMISSAENMSNPKVLLLEFEKEVIKLALHLSSRTVPSHLRMRAKVAPCTKIEDEMEKEIETEPL